MAKATASVGSFRSATARRRTVGSLRLAGPGSSPASTGCLSRRRSRGAPRHPRDVARSCRRGALTRETIARRTRPRMSRVCPGSGSCQTRNSLYDVLSTEDRPGGRAPAQICAAWRSWSRSCAPSASWVCQRTSRGQATSSDSWMISTRWRLFASSPSPSCTRTTSEAARRRGPAAPPLPAPGPGRPTTAPPDPAPPGFPGR